MPFANPLGLIALLAVPAVLALHLFRRRFQPREVSALFLWRARDSAPAAGRHREPLRSSASLWLELACAALLALAFSGPRAGCAGARGEHFVVVLDGSASMAARSSRGAAYERAAQVLRERIDALERGSRVTLVESARHARVLAGPSALPSDALEALASWRPSAPQHDLTAALSLARQFSGEARVVVCTDRFEPQRWGDDIELIATGEPLDNWAFLRAARTLEADASGVERERLYLTLASFAAAERELSVVVRDGERELSRASLRLAAGARELLAFDAPPEGPPLTVHLEDDALAVDNTAWLAPPVRRTLALHSDLPHETLAALGLARGEEGGIERWLALVPRSHAARELARAQLSLGAARETEGPAWFIELAELGSERRDWLGPLLVDRTHPALDGVTLDGLVWSGDPQLRLSGTPLISVGDVALLSEERLGSRRVWRFNLDPQRSSLQRAPDWPILLANLSELRRAAASGAVSNNLALGQRLEYTLDARTAAAAGSDATYELAGPLDSARGLPGAESTGPVRTLPLRAHLEYDGFEVPGWYRLSAGGGELALLGVSFLDGSQSDLRTAGSGRRESTRAAQLSQPPISWLELLAIVLALAAACGDWWVLSRWRRAAPQL